MNVRILAILIALGLLGLGAWRLEAWSYDRGYAARDLAALKQKAADDARFHEIETELAAAQSARDVAARHLVELANSEPVTPGAGLPASRALRLNLRRWPL